MELATELRLRRPHQSTTAQAPLGQWPRQDWRASNEESLVLGEGANCWPSRPACQRTFAALVQRRVFRLDVSVAPHAWRCGRCTTTRGPARFQADACGLSRRV